MQKIDLPILAKAIWANVSRRQAVVIPYLKKKEKR